MLKYLDTKLIEDRSFDNTLLNLPSIINNFHYQFGEDNMNILNSNTIERTMYVGKVGSDGKVIDIINLSSNVYESPYTLFFADEFKICDFILTVDPNVINIGFLSKKSFSDKYYRELYRGFMLSMSEYQHNVLFLICLFVIIIYRKKIRK